MATLNLLIVVHCFGIPPLGMGHEGSDDIKSIGSSEFSHWAMINDIVFNKSGDLVASGSRDHTAIVWDAATGKPRFTLKHSGSVNAVAFSSDGDLLVTGFSESIPMHTVFSQELSSSSPGQAEVWDLATGAALFSLEAGPVYSVAISPDDQIIACGGSGHLTLWDRTTRQLLHRIEAGVERNGSSRTHRSISSLAFSPKGDVIATSGARGFQIRGSEGVVRLWSTQSGKLVSEFDDHIGSVDAVAFSPDGKLLAAGARDGSVKLWNVEDHKMVHSIPAHPHRVRKVAFNQDGTRLLTSNGTVKVWDLGSFEELHTVPGHSYQCAFQPNQPVLATGSYDVRMWRLSESREPVELQTKDNDRISAVVILNDNKTIVTGTPNGKINVQNIPSSTIENSLDEELGWVQSIESQPDTHRVLICDRDGRWKLWNTQTGKVLASGLDPVKYGCPVLSPDGCRIAVRKDDGTTDIIDISKSETRTTIPSGPGSRRDIWLSRNGSQLISRERSSEFSEIRLWDLSVKRLDSIFEYQGYARCVAFGTDGRIAIGGQSYKGLEQDNGVERFYPSYASIEIWHVNHEKPTVLAGPETPRFNHVAFGRGDRLLASTCGDGLIWLFDVESRSVRDKIKLGPTGGTFLSLKFSHDGTRILTVNGNGTVSIVSVDN